DRPGWTRLLPVWLDPLLYAASAVAALLVAAFASIPQYQEWGRIAVGVYAIGAVLALACRSARSRTWLAIGVLLGAALAPMAVETVLRSRTGMGLHAQSEVIITEEAAKAALDGRD